jgi:rhodanese-related sulfurtransferase
VNLVKFLEENWILVLVAAASGGMLLGPALRVGAGGAAVGTAEAVRLINKEKGVLIDVCEPGEFAAAHAAGARNVPLGSLDSHKSLPTNKALPVVVICPSGMRAKRAVARLRKAGYENAVALTGGTAAWREASLPIEKAA